MSRDFGRTNHRNFYLLFLSLSFQTCSIPDPSSLSHKASVLLLNSLSGSEVFHQRPFHLRLCQWSFDFPPQLSPLGWEVFYRLIQLVFPPQSSHWVRKFFLTKLPTVTSLTTHLTELASKKKGNCNAIATWLWRHPSPPTELPTITYSAHSTNLLLILQYDDVWGFLQISPQSRLWWWLAMEATPKVTGLLEAVINIEAGPP